MKVLLDTNVASEVTAKSPSPNVLAWLEAQPPERRYLSTVTIAEISYGFALLPEGARRTRLLAWRDELVAAYVGRILPVDLATATAWGRIKAEADKLQRRMPAMDAFLAATAEVHGLTIVTRNIKDFQVWGGPVFDPWSAPLP